MIFRFFWCYLRLSAWRFLARAGVAAALGVGLGFMPGWLPSAAFAQLHSPRPPIHLPDVKPEPRDAPAGKTGFPEDKAPRSRDAVLAEQFALTRSAGPYAGVRLSLPLASRITDSVTTRRGSAAFSSSIKPLPMLEVETGWADAATGFSAGVRGVYLPLIIAAKTRQVMESLPVVTGPIPAEARALTLADQNGRSRNLLAVLAVGRASLRLIDGRRFFAEVGAGPTTTASQGNNGGGDARRGMAFTFAVGGALAETHQLDAAFQVVGYTVSSQFSQPIERGRDSAAIRTTLSFASVGMSVTLYL